MPQLNNHLFQKATTKKSSRQRVACPNILLQNKLNTNMMELQASNSTLLNNSNTVAKIPMSHLAGRSNPASIQVQQLGKTV
jgi:hypothetical protein